METMIWIIAIGLSALWITIAGLIIWKVYEVIKFMIETLITLHDLGK